MNGAAVSPYCGFEQREVSSTSRLPLVSEVALMCLVTYLSRIQ